jgi:hypothetical protein
MQKLRLSISMILFISLLGFFVSIDEVKAVTTSELEQELKALHNEFEQMKEAYEERIGALERRLAEQKKETPIHEATPVGTYGGIMNPDISVVAHIQTNFADTKTDANRGKVRIKEAEVAFQGYLYPGIRGDVIAAFEQEYEGDSVSTDVDLEEANVSFLELPYGLQAEVGRHFIKFGKLNPVHSHHWPFVDTPRILQNYFGEHSWFDDGILVSALIPNIWDLYLKTNVGWYNGRKLGHAHVHEAGEEEADIVDWDGRVALSRTSLNIPFSEDADLGLGYSLAWDEGNKTELQGADATFSYRWPFSYRKFKWQNELLFSDLETLGTNGWGAYSLAQLTWDKNWEFGLRYDWSQTPDNDQKHEWAFSPFLTYYFTESFYLRGQYRYRELIAEHEPENMFFIQCVWGFGPHAHRLEE